MAGQGGDKSQWSGARLSGLSALHHTAGRSPLCLWGKNQKASVTTAGAYGEDKADTWSSRRKQRARHLNPMEGLTGTPYYPRHQGQQLDLQLRPGAQRGPGVGWSLEQNHSPREGEGGERDKDSRLGQASKLKAQHLERKLTSGKIDKYSTT